MKRTISILLLAAMLLSLFPVGAAEVKNGDAGTLIASSEHNVNTDRLYNTIAVNPGQLDSDTAGDILSSDIYGYVVNYPLKKGHVLTISSTDYVFSVRKLENGSYSTLLKSANAKSYTAAEDMTVGMLIRKPDKSAVTAEELASVVIYDSQFGMVGVEGSVKRFTVEAEAIDGGTATTRAAIFLPESYSETGSPTRLVVMTNGYHGHLTDSVWNANTDDDVAVMQHYLAADYAVLVVDNTAQRTSSAPDWGNPQLVSSYWEAYEYVQENLNVEQRFSIHSRSMGTFAAVRMMRERPELVKCALMCGPVLSLKSRFSTDPAFIAQRYGFDDTTGSTWEADKVVGYDPYTDVNGAEYDLPPTFWMMSSTDAISTHLTTIEKIKAHGNEVTTALYTDTDHSGVCRLNTEQCRADALSFLESHQESAPLAGKTISILGASISTYAGTSNGAAADTTNSTIRNNAKYYPSTTVTDVTLNDTWWMQAANDLGLRLLVNNSWSGSALLHTRSGTAGAYVDRCVQLHDDTGANAGEEPDIIGIQMGTNDFQYYKDTLGTADIDYAALISDNGDGSYTYATPTTSLEAAAIVLHKISVRYPNAEVYYLNLSHRVDGTDALLRQFNADLAEVCERFGAHVVDIYNSGITEENFTDYIGDGRVHPNKLGMDAYTEAFKAALLANTRYSVEYHTVSFDLTDVTADYGVNKQVVSGDSFTVNLSSAVGNTLHVNVTMGGKDITASAYDDGTVTIDAVTDDVVISAQGIHEPQNYRWVFDGSDLVSSDTDGNTENVLTKNAGSVTDGVFNTTKYALENSVVLRHDQPWSVEWKCEGTWQNTSGSGGRLFTSDDVNAHYNARYIFKSSVNGLIAMGEKTTSGSHNYGIALGDHGIDATQLHTYRLENRIGSDGTNMVYLYVDGVEIGPMNNYFVGTANKNTTSDWLSGKDFVFPYIGTDTHGLNNCSIEYIQVWEAGVPAQESTKTMSMYYDDHLDVSGKAVEIVDEGTPTSYQVGYGIAEGTKDAAVVTLDGNTLVASGIGTAVVKLDGVTYTITVEAAPISLILLAGQSNMQGSEGNANQSIVCPEGQVYATYGDRYTMTVDNATNYAASALTGPSSKINVNGTTDNLNGYPIYSLNEAGAGKAGPDSGFGYQWVETTGEKVWIVNAAHGGSSITTWQKGGANYEEAVALFSACQETLRQEIAAGHYTLSHMGYFWCQGCADETKSAEWYVDKFLTMHEALKTDLVADLDSDPATADVTFEFAGIIPIRSGHQNAGSYRAGTYTDTTSAPYFESFLDLRMNGPRVAQYWMGSNPELTDIFNVCTIQENWATMPDGSDGVAEYFAAHYPDGTVDYATQVAQKATWYSPTTPADVHDSIHYNQIGYNEIGREAVRNMAVCLGIAEPDETQAAVKLVGWDGFTEVTEVTASTLGSSGTLVVPMVSPVYLSKEVSYTVSDGLSYGYYDLTANTPATTGTLNYGGNTVTVCKDENAEDVWQKYDLAEHLQQLPSPVYRETNLWDVLEHDTEYFSNGIHWGVHSSSTVRSITIPVSEGDQIYANSFGKAGTNGNASANGIRITFFGTYDVVKTLAPSETYAEFTANGGYLVAPEGAIAVNVVLWKDDADSEVRILNLPHGHQYTAEVTAPTCTADGYTTYTCSGCGDTYKADTVKATGHTEVVIPGKAATETETGLTDGKKCSVCGTVTVEQRVIPLKEHVHSYTSKVTAPTCTADGYTTYTCSGCGDTYKADTVKATGHKEVIIPGKAATETETGLTDGKKCSVCGTVTVKQEIIPVLTHTHKFSYVVENGELYETCSCGHKTAACAVTRNGKTVSVTLMQELYPTYIYAARYSGGQMVEIRRAEVTGTTTNLNFTSDAGTVKVFFLTGNYVPWLNAKAVK